MKVFASVILSVFAGYAAYWPYGNKTVGLLVGLLTLGLIAVFSKGPPVVRDPEDLDGL